MKPYESHMWSFTESGANLILAQCDNNEFSVVH